MSSLLVALLGVLLIPLFVASWRMSLFGLGAQGMLMAMIAWRLVPEGPDAWLAVADLGVLRGFIVPAALYSVLRASNAPARHDVIPPNMLSWTIALGLVLGAFSFAGLLVPEAGDSRTLVAVTAAGVVLGFLVLASQAGPFGQMIGALRLENAIALLELGSEDRQTPLVLRLSLLAVFAVTVACFRGYLRAFSAPVAAVAPATEGPTL